MRNFCVCVALIFLGSYSICAQELTSPPPKPAASPAKTTPSEPATAKSNVTKSGRTPIVLPPEKTRPVQLVRFDKPPLIDGKLDDEVWKRAVVLKDFYQTQPG